MTNAEALAPFLPEGRGMLLAYDHGLEHGPTDFDERSVDPAHVVDLASKGGFTGVVLQLGVAEAFYGGRTPLVLKLNGKTRLPGGEPVSRQIATVDDAVRLDASGVGYTIYLGSVHEPVMLREFAGIRRAAREAGLAVIAWIYPRGAAVLDDTAPEIVSYAARAGLELGADAVKIKYTGDIASFRWAVRAAGPTKVFMSGGPKAKTDVAFLRQVRDILDAGAVGVAVGRNVWQHDDPEGFAARLRALVLHDKPLEEVLPR